jgi:hypothetical protein
VRATGSVRGGALGVSTISARGASMRCGSVGADALAVGATSARGGGPEETEAPLLAAGAGVCAWLSSVLAGAAPSTSASVSSNWEGSCASDESQVPHASALPAGATAPGRRGGLWPGPAGASDAGGVPAAGDGGAGGAEARGGSGEAGAGAAFLGDVSYVSAG